MMKKTLLALTTLAFGALTCQATLATDAGQVLANSKNCMACHTVDKKVVGPAFKDVAAKYVGQKDAAGKLQVKVIKGGGGVWGGFMPANPQVTEAEAKTLVTWILTQK